MSQASNINKDLILREKLAIQRTIMANHSTFLAFLRTALYFMVAGLSMQSLLKIKQGIWLEWLFFTAAFVIVIIGVINYLRHRKKIRNSEKHIGEFKMEYLSELDL